MSAELVATAGDGESGGGEGGGGAGGGGTTPALSQPGLQRLPSARPSDTMRLVIPRDLSWSMIPKKPATGTK